MVLVVVLQVLGEVVDTLGEQRTWTSGEPVSAACVPNSSMMVRVSS